MNKLFAVLLSFATLAVIPACSKTNKVVSGNKAPAFRLQDETGAWRTLEEFRGKRVVLYFYPHDNTPACTAQACSFRDRAYLYTKHNIVILGINYDSPKSHAKFKEEHHLTFPLLTDDGSVARAYGARSGIPLINNFFPNRMTFLINEQGIIVKSLKDIDASAHADDVLKEFGIA